MKPMLLFLKYYDRGMEHFVIFVEIPQKLAHFIVTHIPCTRHALLKYAAKD